LADGYIRSALRNVLQEVRCIVIHMCVQAHLSRIMLLCRYVLQLLPYNTLLVHVCRARCCIHS
jgi:hypothetical protein